ncbi:recombinase family protein [Clostridium estertheticum]|uniref:recombinase family protein n=1 Tax=Clostridium estertheticum TaxID=238834 RepID=UPI0013E95465|nr:recombinase family protein [Clostridium estertheticum]MBZ9684965.1 recombinase family protein [Clostridium estertheticum]
MNDELYQGLIPENYTAIYARHSTKDTKSTSNVTQIDQCKEVASKLNLIVYKSFEDEGSGFTIPPEKRKGFRQLILEAKAGHFKNLIIWKVDRLWRQTNDYHDTVKLLESLGVKLIFSDMLEFENMNPIYRNFMVNMFLSIAELEPNKIKEKTTNGRNHKRINGILFLRYENFGYTSIKNRAYITDKINDADVVKEVKIYYEKKPLEAAFINSCFKIYNNASGDYIIRFKKVQQEIIALGKIFNNEIETNFKNIVENISDEIEYSPIKKEIKKLQKKNSKYTPTELKLMLTKCCTHCSNPATLEYMLTNHHYCGINVINASNNNELLIFDNNDSRYLLNENNVYNMAVNIDAIVDKDLWFEVATHVLNFKRLEIPKETEDILGIKVKCDNCKSKLIFSNDLYTCPKCSITISKNKISDLVIDALIENNIFGLIVREVNLIIRQIDLNIIHLENKVKKHEKNCIKLALDYITQNSKDSSKLINSESEKSKEIQLFITTLQQRKITYLKEIAEQSPQGTNEIFNLRENLIKYFTNNKSVPINFLKSAIRSVYVK